eukprot:TRINITY_DN4263_c0_g1_i3.p1 TRINITY_DN4263_c0_g1~~TRINITY_DN4263_c0_g1_i3.p1  ORF type:complete len:987 (+),score=153.29 TRINITY_DN4263_c0_g1_i3:366-3326(+)
MQMMSSLYTKQDAATVDRRGFAVITMKYKLQKIWNEKVNTPWDKAVLFFSLVSAGVYVGETYEGDSATTPAWSKSVEVVVATFFTFDYGARLYLADSRCGFIMRLASFIDVLCILPVVFIFLLERSGKAHQFIFFLRFLRVVRLIRILRGYRAVSVSKRGDPDNLKKQLNILIYTLATLIFISAALLHLVEKYAKMPWMESDQQGNAELQYFHDAIYFVVITLTTVGYGDITPKTMIGRFLVMIIVTASVIIIPRETGKLSELMSVTSQYAGSYVNTDPDRAHVIVCGHVDFANLRSFLMEFFHEAHGTHRMMVLVMSPSPPSKTVKLLFGQNGLYGTRVQYFEGSALDEYDLSRLQYKKACAAFFLANKLSTDPHLSDCETTMRILSAKNHSPHVPVLAQFLLPESKVQGMAAGADYVVCLRELKMHILARSGLVPGFSTLFCNLFRNEEFVFDEPGHWLTEYCHGISHEIYTLNFPSAFIGKPFPEVAYFIFKEWATILFGVQRTDDNGEISLLLNPIGTQAFLISKRDRGFLFATDASVPDVIENFEGDLLTATPRGSEYPYQTGFHDVVVRGSGLGQSDAKTTMSMKNIRRKRSRRVSAVNIVEGDEREMPPVSPKAVLKRTFDNPPMLARAPLLNLPNLVPLVPSTTDWNRWGHDRIIDSVPFDMRDHILVVVHQIPNVLHFVAPLRVDIKANTSPPIVAMVPAMPSDDILRDASKYPSVFFYIGCGKDKNDFIKCGAARSKSTMIMFSGTIGETRIRYPTDYDEGEDNMADYDAISTFTCLSQVLRGAETPFVLVELVHKQNTRFFPPKHDEQLGKITETNDYIVPSYAAGRVYSDAVMDSLLCQVFYNNDLLRVLKLFLLPPHPVTLHPNAETFTSSGFFSMPIPEAFVGATFGYLLKTLLLSDDHFLPIGLLRAPDRHNQRRWSLAQNSPEPEAGTSSYVFLCPPMPYSTKATVSTYSLTGGPMTSLTVRGGKGASEH